MKSNNTTIRYHIYIEDYNRSGNTIIAFTEYHYLRLNSFAMRKKIEGEVLMEYINKDERSK